MSQHFWVNNYFIDIKRNQIRHQEQLTSIAPKALSVLAILAEHAGDVVSHELLMEQVWPDTVVTTNTLVRCIAQLRKAFGDDSKNQIFIKTHSKQGYSLEANVFWNNPQSPLVDEDWDKAIKQPVKNNLALALPMIILVVCVGIWKALQPDIHQFTQVKPLTASDDKETNARYSPDGKYLVFHRFSSTCEHHIWAKDLATQQEFRLTKDAGVYGSHSWSRDGAQLVFSQQEYCGKPVPLNEQCWSVGTLEFSAALQSPQLVTKRIDCDVQRNGVTRFLPHGKIGMLRQIAPYQNKIAVFDPRDNHLHDIYGPTDRYIYSYDYSFVSNHLAVISRDGDNKHYIEVVSLDGKQLSRHEITRTTLNSSNEFYNIYYHPNGKSLITDTETGLFNLSIKGQLLPISTLSQRNLFDANYHPSGTKLVASQLNSDEDILYLSRNISELSATTIAPSSSVDVNGKFQPQGTKIAFMSNRSGVRQIWLADGDKVTQLSHLKLGLAADSLAWSSDGKLIAAISHDRLVVFDVAGGMEQYSLPRDIKSIMQWTSENTLLIGALNNNQSQVFKATLNSKKMTVLMHKIKTNNVLWAQTFSHVNKLFINENNDVFINDKHVPILKKQVNKQSIVVFNDQIWGVNQAHQLWLYDIAGDHFKILHSFDNNPINLSDVNDQGLLFNRAVSTKKELIEFE